MLPAPGTIIVRACILFVQYKSNSELEMCLLSHQSFVPKMRARVGERAVPKVQNTIARKMAGFLPNNGNGNWQLTSNNGNNGNILIAYLP